MDRRKFLSSGTIGLGAISMVPSAIFANNNSVSLFSVGEGFNRISNQISHTSVALLPQRFLETHTALMQILAKKGYNFSSSEVVKLSSNCFAIPLSKNPIIGFSTKGLALLIEQKGRCKYYILNENTTIAFNSLIENFSKSSDSHELSLDVAAFSVPKKVIKESHGKENKFVYKNTNGNTITLVGSSKRQVAIVN
ncbi:hypothetical protein [Flavivirga eckloniae]|uniref:Uncharacterized protein n=1 Tax=Flavivirga eckloniae TaxID=1803846 RepID=A0A2K9PQC8_9FLAO|nr:hypothetical protein [Flavivirga eckloniae]AUP79272.1 hypothetical protein C1H87_11380 [Flavivirga eckloniae]